MMGSACILTNGKLDQIDAKTAHGLIRGTERFDIIGVVDAAHAGRDAGEVLDGRTRNIMVYSSIADLLDKSAAKPEFAIVGVALSGGLPADWHRTILNTLEHAIVSCVREASPELILIEGQSGLRNPPGPCGSEFIVSGRARGVILHHAPFKTYYDDLEKFKCRIPDVADEIRLIELLGAETLALTLKSEGGDEQAMIAAQEKLRARLGIPVVRPLEEGVAALLEVIERFMQDALK